MIQMMLPQRRRPTASARRQQEVAPVAKDDPVVPADIHAPSVEDDPVVAADVHAAGVDAANDAEGFPGESRDPSVLIEYADHVVVSVLVKNNIRIKLIRINLTDQVDPYVLQSTKTHTQYKCIPHLPPPTNQPPQQ